MNFVLLAVEDPHARIELKRHFGMHKQPVIEGTGASSVANDVGLFVVECSVAAPDGRLALIERFRILNPRVPVVAFAVNSSEDLAVGAFRLGVRDYFRWPEHAGGLTGCLDSCLSCPPGAVKLGRFIGHSPGMRSVREAVERAATTDSNVLVTGETGTGKELVAESVHRLSSRCHKPLVSVNCAAIPETLLESELFGYEKGSFTGANASREGKLQQAHEGTIFFDEIGDMHPHGQAKLLRAVETREVFPLGRRSAIRIDTRIIAATNQDLETLTKAGGFRADLLFRLNVVRIHLPPLRERVADIPILAAHFIRLFNQRWGMRVERFDPECELALAKYDWPGNVRELRNVVEAAYVNAQSRVIATGDLPSSLLAHITSDHADTDERRRLTDTLFALNWNVSKVAARLRWSRMTVYRKLARYNIARDGNVTGDSTEVTEHVT